MKRFAVMLVALVMATSMLPAAAQPTAQAEQPEAFASAEQLAEADWIVMDGRDHANLFFALGMRTVTRRGLRTLGVIGKGDCSVERSRYFTMITCEGSGRGRQLTMDQFSFDPALRSASLTFKAGGDKQKVRWRGIGRTPWSSGNVGGDGRFVAVDAFMSRGARAEASLYGRRMPGSDGGRVMAFSSLSQGGAVVAAAGSRNFEIAPDGSYTYDVRIRIPR